TGTRSTVISTTPWRASGRSSGGTIRSTSGRSGAVGRPPDRGRLAHRHERPARPVRHGDAGTGGARRCRREGSAAGLGAPAVARTRGHVATSGGADPRAQVRARRDHEPGGGEEPARVEG